jgi:hypothetical protein
MHFVHLPGMWKRLRLNERVGNGEWRGRENPSIVSFAILLCRMQRYSYFYCQSGKEFPSKKERMKKITVLFAVVIFTALPGCRKNSNCDAPNCDKTVTIDKVLYNNINTGNYTLSDATINGNCLEIKVGASGCDGKSWVIELVDSEVIAESDPQQRFLKLALTNNEMCTAVFVKKKSFDITSLRVRDSNKLRLMIYGLNKELIYTY